MTICETVGQNPQEALEKLKEDYPSKIFSKVTYGCELNVDGIQVKDYHSNPDEALERVYDMYCDQVMSKVRETGTGMVLRSLDEIQGLENSTIYFAHAQVASPKPSGASDGRARDLDKTPYF